MLSDFSTIISFMRSWSMCYSMRLDLLTNATVVDDAIRFVSQKSEDKQESSNSYDENHKGLK